jgi:hypothetical protein
MDVKRRRFVAWVTVACAYTGVACLEACMEGEPATPGLPGVDASLSDNPSDGGAESATVTACPEGGYPDCPSPPPSWATQVRGIVDVGCAPCHFNGGTGTGLGDDFSTTRGLRHTLTTALTDLQRCTMPPSGSAVLSLADRETLMEWLVCGAPDD